MPACMVQEGDVVRLLIPGDNGVDKKRICVVMERLPSPSKPEAVLIIFGCSETKYGSIGTRFFRIEYETTAARTIGLSNATTFHIEDTRGFDAHSPQLVKIGRCPMREFLELKKLIQVLKAEGSEIQVLPDRARAAAREAVAAMTATALAALKSDGPENP